MLTMDSSQIECETAISKALKAVKNIGAYPEEACGCVGILRRAGMPGAHTKACYHNRAARWLELAAVSIKLVQELRNAETIAHI